MKNIYSKLFKLLASFFCLMNLISIIYVIGCFASFLFGFVIPVIKFFIIWDINTLQKILSLEVSDRNASFFMFTFSEQFKFFYVLILFSSPITASIYPNSSEFSDCTFKLLFSSFLKMIIVSMISSFFIIIFDINKIPQAVIFIVFFILSSLWCIMNFLKNLRNLLKNDFFLKHIVN